jgi:O-antigen/teichoic acid export membrane protein
MAEIEVAIDRRSETKVAIHNAFKLTGSLFVTWGIGLAVRFVLPRHLGPERFGDFNFADALAATACVALHLGVDMYVRREVAVNPREASGFFGGVQIVRAAATLLILPAIALMLSLNGRPQELILLSLLFVASQYFVATNATLGAMLQARGTVTEMSVLSIVSKLSWGAVILLGIVINRGLYPFALAMLLSEATKAVGLYLLAKRYLGLELRFEARATASMLRVSFPFFLGAAAQAAHAKIDVAVLAFSAPPVEVGYYSAASSIAGIGMLLAPLMSWVLAPMLSRAAARSGADLDRLMRRSFELVMTTMLPGVLLLGIGAEFWTKLIVGQAFSPSALALGIVAVALVMTYVGALGAGFLVVLDRGWALTGIMTAGMLLNVVLNLVLIRPAIALLHRPGAAGVGSAVALLVSETAVGVAMMSAVGRRAWDLRLSTSLAKGLAICAAVIIIDRTVLFRLGPLRLPVDALLYAAVAAVTGVLRLRETLALLRREEPPLPLSAERPV